MKLRTEIHDLYLSPSTAGVLNRRPNHVGRKRSLYMIFDGKPQGNKSLRSYT